MNKQSEKQSGSMVLLVVVGIAVICLVGFIAWRWYDAANIAVENSQKNTKQTDKTTPNPAVKELGYEGKRYTSSQKAFSIVVPNGWGLTTNTEFDGLFSSGLNASTTYDVSKAPVVEETAYGKDGPSTFAAVVNVDSGYDSSAFDPITGEPFSTNAGAAGTKKLKIYKAGEALGMSQAEGGEKQYLYEFKKGDKFYSISYYVADNEPDDHGFVEKVVRSLEIN